MPWEISLVLEELGETRMSKLANWKLEKAKMRMNASNAKPEGARFDKQLGIEKSLLEMQKDASEPSRQINDQMFGELSQKWKGNKGGSSGDALISGLTAGLKEGSFSDDKKRSKQIMEFTEKMRDMVAKQNVELFEKEKLANAKQAAAPRIMAYLDSYKTMSPNDRKVYLQNSMDEYNQAAGTDYKIIDATGAEPWKVIVSDGQETEQLDLMNFIQTPEEQKLQYYLNSNEAKEGERELQNEDRLNREILENQAKYTKARADEKSPQNVQDRKQQLIEQGEIPKGSLLFDELPQHEAKAWVDDLRVERDKGREAKAGSEALDAMGKIFEDHPKISTSLAKWANSKGDSPINNLIKSLVNQDERNAILELEKHAATLALGTIQQFKGQRPTDILKKLIKETNPGANFTPQAFEPIKNQLKNKFDEQIQRSTEAERGLMKRYVPTYENINKPSSNNSEIEKSALDQEEQALLKEKAALLNGQ
jgi:hypothetical protein